MKLINLFKPRYSCDTLKLLSKLHEMEIKLMATKQEVLDAIAAEKQQVLDAVTALHDQIQALQDQIANGSAVTAADLDDLKTAVNDIFTP